jgi:hypothetical protein
MTMDSTSTVTLRAVTASGDSTALVSTLGSQPVAPGTLRLSAGVATWTGLRFTATGLYKFSVASSVAGIPETTSLAISITN